MSGETDKESQTEAPTPKKLEDARKKGQIASSPETKHGAMFAAAIFGLGLLGMAGLNLKIMLARMLEGAHEVPLDSGGTMNFLWGVSGRLSLTLLPVFGLFIAAAILGGVLQGRPTLSWSRVKPKFSKLNPMSNFKRIFGPVEFLKTLAKFSVVLVAAVIVLWPSLYALEAALFVGPGQLLVMAESLLWKLLLTITIIVVGIAVADNVYQRIAFLKRMRMTKQQVKDEHKDTEGDPHIKARVRAIQRERSRQRMMAAVPTASVVITNPTHYSVALTYEHGKSNAPKVVAKGVDEVAMRIREMAAEHGVPVIAKPPLARALYASVKIDQEVPEEHFVAVAEVISYVMKLKDTDWRQPS
jgi:flagellar biosynthetic protein FlhB